ncbi:unnamed protein product [Victoria cruziana]
MVSSGGERPSSGLRMKGGNISPFESLSHVAYHFSTSGLAVATATGFTHPLDVVKVRLQMQLVGQRGHLDGMGKIFVQMLKVEGPKALYLGLGPALIRSLLYGGLRLGLYEPCKYVCDLSFGSTNVFVKLAAGAFSGTIATAFTNPAEVLKWFYSSEEGLKALWKGVGPAMTRAAGLTASQLATYDESKQMLTKWASLSEGFHLHLISSAIAGTMGTLVTTPMDMVKTRLMMQKEINNVGVYRNGLQCAYQVVRTEGPLALYKGGFAIFARLGPQTMITFLVCEKLRELAGMRAI